MLWGIPRVKVLEYYIKCQCFFFLLAQSFLPHMLITAGSGRQMGQQGRAGGKERRVVEVKRWKVLEY